MIQRDKRSRIKFYLRDRDGVEEKKRSGGEERDHKTESTYPYIISCINSSLAFNHDRSHEIQRPMSVIQGEGDSRSVLDAFFLGKALAEALKERIESSVGEFLITIGRLQAVQQKQVEDFQADVLERAKWKAAEAQGLVSKSATENITPETIANGVSPITATSSTGTVVTPVDQPSLSEPTPSTTQIEPDPGYEDSASEVPIDD